MIRYEANINGTVEDAEIFTDFDEVEVFVKILVSLELDPVFITAKRGGYYLLNINVNERKVKLHVYLKKLTFGGRENRPYEKRAQFSAGLDRRGFMEEETEEDISLILAIYKRQVFKETIICTWDIHDWGYNIGRAFNCFIDIRSVAEALKNGFAQHRTSIGQVACCFKPDYFLYYLENRKELHKRIASLEIKENNIVKIEVAEPIKVEDSIPKFEDLFQVLIDALQSLGGIGSVNEIEKKVADTLNLSKEAREQVYNMQDGYRTVLGYRLAWARFYLKKANILKKSDRSVWQLTETGKSTLKVDKEKIKKIATNKEIEKEVKKDSLYDIKADEYNIEIEEEDNELYFEEITTPFNPNDVNIKTVTVYLSDILDRLDKEEIDINTNFQRKAGVWDNTKQSRLIESILIKFPLPAFYFDGSNDNKWLVVDGLQRLSSLDNFVNKQSFGLQNLEFLYQFEGRRFSALPSNLQRRIEEFEITAYIISPGTPQAVKYNIFKRINTGGVILSPQEIRNAIYQGTPADYIKSLAELRSFKQATSFSIPEDRMLDREFVNRFLAFYIINIENYKSDIDLFLNQVLDSLYYFQKADLDEIQQRFDNAMITAFQIFRDDAFRKRYSVNDKRKPINKALFEVWAVLLTRLSKSQTELLIQKREEVISKFTHLLLSDDEFNQSITSGTGKKNKVKKRFLEIERIIQSTLSS